MHPDRDLCLSFSDQGIRPQVGDLKPDVLNLHHSPPSAFVGMQGSAAIPASSFMRRTFLRPYLMMGSAADRWSLSGTC